MTESDSTNQNHHPFDAETWSLLPGFFDQMPHRVFLSLWADPQASIGEAEAAKLCRALADHFEKIEFGIFPRRINYSFYPVIGAKGLEEDEEIDYGVRIIGLPAGVQLTALIAAIQAVSFRGVTLEPRTRLLLQNLKQDVRLEILTAADDEAGALMAKTAFGLAVASPHIRSFLIMADVFPEAIDRYSAQRLPHTVINGRHHLEGVLDEESLVRRIAAALKN